jgi:hypothetical protein
MISVIHVKQRKAAEFLESTIPRYSPSGFVPLTLNATKHGAKRIKK